MDLSILICPLRDDLPGQDENLFRQISVRIWFESSDGFPSGTSCRGIGKLCPDLAHDADVKLKNKINIFRPIHLL